MSTKNKTVAIRKVFSSNLFRWLFFVFFLFLLLLDYIIDPITSFYIKSVFLSAYMVAEIYHYKIRFPENWLLSPAVLASILTYILGFSITNFIYLIDGSRPFTEMYDKLGSDPFPQIIKALDYIIISSFAMWIGYDSLIGNKTFNLLTRTIKVKRFIKLKYIFNFKLIITLALLSILARLYGIYSGSFGFGLTPEQLNKNLQISFFLSLLGSLGKFALLVISLSFYSLEKNKINQILFIFIVLVELIFGLISGMKSAVVIPFALPLITYYIAKKKVHKTFLITSIVFLFFAYSVIEPYRIFKLYSVNNDNSPSQIIIELYEAYKINQQYSLTNKFDDDVIFVSVAGRNNYLIAAARAIEYDKNPGLKGTDPDFFVKIVTIPIQAFVPRIIWSNKPEENFSRWFSIIVWGGTAETSVAMTPIGFLNFAGGLFFVVVFFFIFGVMQKTLFQFFKMGSGGKIIYFGLLSSLIFIDSAVNGIFVDWLRLYPMLLVLQYFTFRK